MDPSDIPYDIQDTSAKIVYSASNSGSVSKSGRVIHLSVDDNEDIQKIHLLASERRVVVASLIKSEVRSVAVEETIIDEVGWSHGPEGYDTLAASHLGRKIGEHPEVEILE